MQFVQGKLILNFETLSWMLICSGVNDRQKGHTDEYTGENVLGTCFLFDLGKPSAIEVHKHFTQN